jgi:flagellar motor switch protein FliM
MSEDPQVAAAEEVQMLPEEPSAQTVLTPVVRDAVEIAEKIHASFLQAVQPAICELLQVPVAMAFQESIQAPFSTALKSIGSSNHALVFALSPVPGYAFLTFPVSLLFRILDILLAMPDTSGSDAPRRALTGIELHILEEFFNIFARPLRESWEHYYPVAFLPTPVSPDEPEQFAAECGGDLAVILRATLDLTGNLASESADIQLIIPAFLARMVELKSKGERDAGPGPVSESVLNSVADANLRIDAVLAGSSILIRDLLHLTPGQVLVVGDSKGSPFDCLVNGKRLFTGDLLASNNRCGIQIEKLITL